MSERLPEPTPPLTYYPPIEPDQTVARKNLLLGWALFALVLLIAAGAVGVSLLYLHYS